MPGLAVRRLSLSDFRCYSGLALETDPRPVVLTGPNGAGKTNLLEALSLLVPGRGMRRAGLGEMARQGGSGAWAVAAWVDGLLGPVELGTGQAQDGDRRQWRVDRAPAKGQDMGQHLSALWLTPAMDRIFAEGAGGRRRFLDRLVFGQDPAHAARATAYEHAMRERNRLFKQAGGRADRAWAATLETAMAQHGTAMAVARRMAVDRLDRACARGIGPFPAAQLGLKGEVEDWVQELGEVGAEDRFREQLARARMRDETAGGATIGPHRTDFLVRHAVKDMPVALCSTGEQKAVLVSIVLAQARLQKDSTGAAPLLLLDEVVAHLDQIRRAALFDELCATAAQSWLSGTDASLFAGFGERAQFFRVIDATVIPAQQGCDQV